IWSNTIEDSASFAIKLRSDAPRGVQRVLVADNIIRGGANGISVGTNKKDETPQFQHLVIANNEFHHLGRNIAGNPQSIGIDIHSVDGGRVLGNRFYDKALKTPHYAIRVRNYPQADLVVAGNRTKGWDKTFKFERTE